MVQTSCLKFKQAQQAHSAKKLLPTEPTGYPTTCDFRQQSARSAFGLWIEREETAGIFTHGAASDGFIQTL